METRQYIAYTFKELSKEAQKKAIEKNRHINVEENYWSDDVIEHWTEVLKTKGYEDIEIMFDGFSSQGDGACFTGTVIIPVWLKANHQKSDYAKLVEAYESGLVIIDIEHNSRYFYETSTTVSYDVLMDEKEKAFKVVYAQAEALAKMIEDDRAIQGKAIYKELKNSYFEATSDEAVIDTLEVNEYMFLEDGTLDNH